MISEQEVFSARQRFGTVFSWMAESGPAMTQKPEIEADNSYRDNQNIHYPEQLEAISHWIEIG